MASAKSTGGERSNIHFFCNLFILTLFIVALPGLILLGYNGPKGIDANQYPSSENKPGYWGRTTSNVNWCEKDYEVTYYIAEFWNTLSSFTMVFNGSYGLLKHAAHVELRYIVGFILFFVVGLGSVAFHGTLWRSSQLLDELPMVWGNTVFYYILGNMEDKPGTNRTKQMLFLIVATVLITLAIIEFDKEDQTIFILAYGTGVIYAVVMSRRYNQKYGGSKYLLLESSVAFYLGGFVLWTLDRNFCRHLSAYYLHAYWHVCAGTGTFLAMVFWMWTRQMVLGDKKVQLKGSTPFTKWVHISKA